MLPLASSVLDYTAVTPTDILIFFLFLFLF